MAGKSRSADMHRQQNYPVIDADGHWIEFERMLLEYLNGAASLTMVDRFRCEDYLAGTGSSSRMTIAERRARCTAAFLRRPGAATRSPSTPSLPCAASNTV